MNGCLCQTDSECEVYDYGGWFRLN
jgi:hypothetical protein